MDKGDQTGIAGIGIGFFLAVGTLMWPWPIPDAIKHVLFWISAAFVLAGCLWLLDLHSLNKKAKPYRWGVPVFLVILLAFIIVWVEWPRPSENPDNYLDNQIAVNCDPSMPPTNLSEEQDIQLYELGAPPTYFIPAPNAGVNTYFERGTGPINWGSKPVSEAFTKCTISNYSNTSLINVTMIMPTYYSPMIKSANGFTGGKIIDMRYIFSPGINLGPVASSSNSGFFYVWNPNPVLAQIQIPKTIQVSVSGSSLDRQTVKILPPNPPGWASIWTMPDVKSPPTLPHQAPKQQ